MTNVFEVQLDKIRVEIYEQTKAITNIEAVRATNQNARKIAAQYGIKIVKGAAVPAEQNARAL